MIRGLNLRTTPDTAVKSPTKPLPNLIKPPKNTFNALEPGNPLQESHETHPPCPGHDKP